MQRLEVSGAVRPIYMGR